MTHAETSQYDPIKAAWNTVASFPVYDDARAAVGHLSKTGFPVENLDIIGSDLRLVERVTGRMTRTRAVLNGAFTGAGIGLFFGLLLGLFSPGFAWLGLVMAGAAVGATWGAAFGFASSVSVAGRQEFSSTKNLVAQRYDLVARGGYTDRARIELGQAGLLP
ncbi:general stress protein [Phytoactinopolyspora limicola]|uniref:general stress protein n=1 Tax=Phytoactinopolyspora limicola TaxID=2715536 RepID=UPI00140B8318|nr:general stress protein [Phytoactinopolyspora limicola]